MLVPRRNNFGLFDDFFDEDFFTKKEKNLMKTDIREKENEYIIDIDLPGFSKENINLSLENGYLNISAKTENNNDENNDKYIRQERFYGECSRSFYVGDDIKEEDIDAEFKNGILKITVPKQEEMKKLNEPKKIEIK
ncbi:MAG: Hsp20/alpha crystallin family protein [Bacilli bacterium]|nr:Hsp20/alpha crystallin family protein [Bacilli bacterium]